MPPENRKYGIRALIDIAQMPSGATATAAEIAERHGMAGELLDEILIRLRNSGFVLSKSEQAEDFTLSRQASEIRMGDVLRAFEPVSASCPCATSMATGCCTGCATPRECLAQLAIGHVRDNITIMLDETSLAALVGAPPISTISVLAAFLHEEIRRVGSDNQIKQNTSETNPNILRTASSHRRPPLAPRINLHTREIRGNNEE